MNLAAIAILVLVFGGGWIVWSISRKIVRLGFYVLYLSIGAGLTYAGQIAIGKEPTLTVAILGGVAFATLVIAIRRKIFKLVSSAVAMVLIGFLGGNKLADHIEDTGKHPKPPLKKAKTAKSPHPGVQKAKSPPKSQS